MLRFTRFIFIEVTALLLAKLWLLIAMFAEVLSIFKSRDLRTNFGRNHWNIDLLSQVTADDTLCLDDSTSNSSFLFSTRLTTVQLNAQMKRFKRRMTRIFNAWNTMLIINLTMPRETFTWMHFLLLDLLCILFQLAATCIVRCIDYEGGEDLLSFFFCNKGLTI